MITAAFIVSSKTMRETLEQSASRPLSDGWPITFGKPSISLGKVPVGYVEVDGNPIGSDAYPYSKPSEDFLLPIAHGRKLVQVLNQLPEQPVTLTWDGDRIRIREVILTGN